MEWKLRRALYILSIAALCLAAAGCGSNDANRGGSGQAEAPAGSGDNGSANGGSSNDGSGDNGSDSPAEQPSAEQPSEEPAEDPSAAPSTPEETAELLAKLLKEKDLEALAEWIHPEHGVRVSPYAYVDTENDLVFQAEQFKGLFEDPTSYEWGVAAGSGEPIVMSFPYYWDNYLWSKDFTAPDQVSVDSRIGESTTVSNLDQIYAPEQHAVVELYVAGTDPEAEGMDWSSLRLVLEKSESSYRLVGIVHDAWTP